MIVGITTPIVIERATYNYAWGRVRRVKSLPGKRFAAITTSGVVFCAEEGGALLWQRKIPSIPRDLDVSPCGKFLAVGSEANYAEELSLSDGSTQRIFQVDAPIWSLCYLPNGRLLLGTRGKKLLLVEAGCLLPAQSIPVYDNAKSMQLTAQKTVVVNGPGYIVEYDAETLEKIRSWSEGLTTTCEAVTLLGDRVYGLSYNLVLSTFNYQSTELLNEQTTVHDFPKAIQTWTGPSGSTHLLVAGRGAYVATYHLRSEAPVKNFELFLSHDNMRSL